MTTLKGKVQANLQLCYPLANSDGFWYEEETQIIRTRTLETQTKYKQVI